MNIVRDAPIGTWLRWTAFGRKNLPYPEEVEGYQVPARYLQGNNSPSSGAHSPAATLTEDPLSSNHKKSGKDQKPDRTPSKSKNLVDQNEKQVGTGGKNGKDGNVPNTQQGKEAGLESGPAKSENPADNAIPPGVTLVDWNGDDDPEHPWNWSAPRHLLVAFTILFLTFNVYGGSSIITSSFPGIQAKFGVGTVEVTVLLSLYVFAYGFGALVFSPLSEIPILGRNVFYIYPMILFVALQAGTSTVETFYGLCILRFLTGFMGAPCLATGAASLQDAFSPALLGPLISFWALAAFAAPSVAPTMGNYSAYYTNDWHWPMYILLIQIGITTLLLAFLPETSHSFILLNRAKRLRKLTGNKNLMSQAEIDQSHLTPNGIFLKAIVRPTEIFFKDPAITLSLFLQSSSSILLHEYSRAFWNRLFRISVKRAPFQNSCGILVFQGVFLS